MEKLVFAHIPQAGPANMQLQQMIAHLLNRKLGENQPLHDKIVLLDSEICLEKWENFSMQSSEQNVRLRLY